MFFARSRPRPCPPSPHNLPSTTVLDVQALARCCDAETPRCVGLRQVSRVRVPPRRPDQLRPPSPPAHRACVPPTAPTRVHEGTGACTCVHCTQTCVGVGYPLVKLAKEGLCCCSRAGGLLLPELTLSTRACGVCGRMHVTCAAGACVPRALGPIMCPHCMFLALFTRMMPRP